MPPASKRPSPPARMVALLAAEKRRLLAEKGHVTRQDFDEAWAACYAVMVDERAWPHNTEQRRIWREVQDETKPECLAAFLDVPTPFAFAAGRMSEAAGGMCLRLEPEQVGRALLAAIAYVAIEDEATASRASTAANAFVMTTEMEAAAA